MGRRSSRLKITNREIKLFKQLARTGLTDEAQAKIFCDIKRDRLKRLEEEKYIKLEKRAVEGKNTLIVQLDKRGKEWCKNEANIQSFAAAQKNHLTHDLRLSATYYSIPEQIRETWQHERDLIKEIYERSPEMKGKLKTCIDGRIQVNGSYVAIEVVGDSYGQQEIQMKQEIALEYLQCQSIEFV